MFFTAKVFAQIDSVVYYLDGTDTAKVSAITDNIEASPLTVHGSLVIWDFSSDEWCPGTSNKMRINKGLTGWAVDGPEQGPQEENFIQVVVSPKAGLAFQVDSVNAWIACFGTHWYMHCAAYWDTDTNFFSFNNEILYDSLSYDGLGEDPGLPDIRDDCTLIHDTSFAIGTTIPNGGYFALRFFPWTNWAWTTTRTTKWIVLWDLRIYGSTKTTEELTESLIEDVQDLVDMGILNKGQSNALTVKLVEALKMLAKGKTNTAIKNLNAFINQVNAFINGGILTETKGEELISAANHIKDQIESSLPKRIGGYVSTKMQPECYSLAQNYPNPFNPKTTIVYGLPEDASVILKIYNVLGAEVMRFTEGRKQTGYHEISFDASNLPSGIYFYRLQAGSFVEIKKMVLLK